MLAEHEASRLGALAPADKRNERVQAARRAGEKLYKLVSQTAEVCDPVSTIAGTLLEFATSVLETERKYLQTEARAEARGEVDTVLRALEQAAKNISAIVAK